MTNSMNTGWHTRPSEGKNNKTTTNMVPLFSWRSVLSLALGAVLGALLGLGYYYAYPLINPATNQVWESNVQILVTNPTNTYIDSRTLQNRMESYIIKTQSLAFLEFLISTIDDEEPQYSHTINEMADMIDIEYDTSASSMDTSYIMTVTASSAEEALYLAVRIPEIFRSYLVSEETDKQQQQYQNTLDLIETTRVALIDAQSELINLAPAGIAGEITNDPDYLLLSAKIKALQDQLDKLMPGLVDMITQDTNNNDEYLSSLMDAVDRTNEALVEAQKELAILETQWTGSISPLNMEYQLAQDKVNNLNNLLTSLNEKRDSFLINNADTSRIIDYLVIANPSMPVRPASLKLSATILIGVLIGIIIAWVILNLRWFTQGTSVSDEKEEDLL